MRAPRIFSSGCTHPFLKPKHWARWTSLTKRGDQTSRSTLASAIRKSPKPTAEMRAGIRQRYNILWIVCGLIAGGEEPSVMDSRRSVPIGDRETANVTESPFQRDRRHGFFGVGMHERLAHPIEPRAPQVADATPRCNFRPCVMSRPLAPRAAAGGDALDVVHHGQVSAE